MSIWTGRDGYNSIKEFSTRTRKELADVHSELFQRDTCPPKEEVDWICSQLAKAPTDASVLEIGCGFGIWSQYVHDVIENSTYMGIDPVMQRIEFAFANFSTPQTFFVVADARIANMNWMYDVVLSVTVLQHMNLADTLLVLDNVRRHLVVGGIAILLESSFINCSLEMAESIYKTKPSHMICKPLWLVQERIPELEWRRDSADDRWILTRTA